MKIPFDIKFKPQIESGEYKVETFSGYPVTIYRWDFEDGERTPIMGSYVFEDGKEYVGVWSDEGHFEIASPNDLDLFIITPEPELSEFELKVHEILYSDKPEYSASEPESWKRASSELLALARKELEPKIKAEALRTRATKLTENLAKSGLDEDSVPYHLIDFMCNLYTCPNWKEIEETAELYVPRLKAAALKDLPRWRKWGDGACGNGQGIPIAIVKRGLNGYELVDSLGIPGEQYIMLSDLEKHPRL